jgi:hypothetical protein
MALWMQILGGGGLMLLAVGPLVSGCAVSRGGNTLESEDPSRTVPAMVAAGESRDVRSVPRLVELLESPDAGIRFYAIQSLERITGESKGYHYYDPEPTRAGAVAAWRADRRWFPHPTTTATAPAPVGGDVGGNVGGDVGREGGGEVGGGGGVK